jgi:probable HAF family extracellular repeat protein
MYNGVDLPLATSALNAVGQVVGVVAVSDGPPPPFIDHAALYESGVLHDLGTLGGDGSSATAINAVGQIGGEASLPDGLSHAFLYDSGGMRDLGTLGGRNSSATAINAVAQVVGVSDLPDGSSHAFLYDSGGMHDFGTLHGVTSSPSAINAVGQIVGQSDGDGFLYESGHMRDLGPLPSGFIGINDAGQLVGTFELPDGTSHAILYDSGGRHDLGTLGGRNTHAAAINAAGQIVGYSDLRIALLTPSCTTAAGCMTSAHSLEVATATLLQLTR